MFSTTHRIIFKDARNLHFTDCGPIHLVVTSPPYPMIRMWDDVFFKMNAKIKRHFEQKNYNEVFELMHQELDKVWEFMYQVLVDGGMACINIGDAIRTLDGEFRSYTNHERIISACRRIGFDVLPSILWIKATNKPNKFMGSGMLPGGAYVTLEHEHILILRKHGKREFSSIEEKKNRRQSAYFWEERNLWFSDLWIGIRGVAQKLSNGKNRDRSAAFPLEISKRLINMYSVHGDSVFDPFLGIGTTSLAAILNCRNSIGVEIDCSLSVDIKESIDLLVDVAETEIHKRLKNHDEFIKNRIQSGKPVNKHYNENYNFPVITGQEVDILIPVLKDIVELSKGYFEARYIK